MQTTPTSLQISPTHPEYAKAVLAFELENRRYFEQWIATRGDDYYHEQAVSASLQQAQMSANLQKECHYLAWVGSEIVGRVTLRHIDRVFFHQATLGYRFSQRHAGQGFATAAVDIVIQLAVADLHLRRLKAVVAAGNKASQRIMEKCHFQCISRSHATTLLHGKWLDVLHYERRLSP
ncbi:GNAT family N-acetyltransferase [Undibacterium sp. SXout7W]|uniref:GNAT family N-acetyltransferase n=1 Tax=Undibacterium sp. SXout7W TaxID=3413049 RepID=UPI003BF33A5A